MVDLVTLAVSGVRGMRSSGKVERLRSLGQPEGSAARSAPRLTSVLHGRFVLCELLYWKQMLFARIRTEKLYPADLLRC